MDLILNGEPRKLDVSECANFAELIAAAEQIESAQSECVVVAIEVDGEALSPEELAELETRSLEGVRCVSIERRPTREVARSVLAQGADYTGQITVAIAQTVDHYRSSRSDLANALLADVIDSMTVLTGITYSVSSVLAEEAQVLADLQGEIYPWLEELMQAQTEKDPIRIADALEYEVAPRIEDWGVKMRGLSAASGAEEGARRSGGDSASN